MLRKISTHEGKMAEMIRTNERVPRCKVIKAVTHEIEHKVLVHSHGTHGFKETPLNALTSKFRNKSKSLDALNYNESRVVNEISVGERGHDKQDRRPEYANLCLGRRVQALDKGVCENEENNYARHVCDNEENISNPTVSGIESHERFGIMKTNENIPETDDVARNGMNMLSSTGDISVDVENWEPGTAGGLQVKASNLQIMKDSNNLPAMEQNSFLRLDPGIVDDPKTIESVMEEGRSTNSSETNTLSLNTDSMTTTSSHPKKQPLEKTEEKLGPVYESIEHTIPAISDEEHIYQIIRPSTPSSDANNNHCFDSSVL